ncbi:EAL domain-containing protein [Nodosilinea nodulosa]|uniref:EAL domain-containing protein n=1 Tax=Nodosilinea nodulosa TaxID=416001 RepID=UPI0003133897|nr:EAL domain-containing protein [Nodosilinea nodulosa]
MFFTQTSSIDSKKLDIPEARSTDILVFKEENKIVVKKLDKETLTIGRSSDDDVLLRSKGVSRCHATVYFSEGATWIIDGDLKGRVSTNGLFVNGAKVSVYRLNQYDVISFQRGVYALFLSQKSCSGTVNYLEEAIQNLAYFIAGKNAEGIPIDQLSLLDQSTQATVLNAERAPLIDSLTRLPNREAFFTRVQKSLEFRNKILSDYNFAVLFIDVDRFKMINDSLGHLVGDDFLIRLARRLSRCLREGDMVARLGGDEFAILLDDLRSFSEAIDIAKRLQQSVSKPLDVAPHELYPSVSVGIALSSLGYQTVEEIIRDADTAMYHAKNTGRSRFVVFDTEMHQKATNLLRLDSDLRRAIDKRQLELYYQPIVSLADKKLIGFEALLRWNHPDNGLIGPDTFVPMAEEANLIYQIGQWVLDEACLQLSQWKANPAIKDSLSVNVNISSKQLTESRLVDRLLATVRRHDISPDALHLEVTESILMENTVQSLRLLSQLKQAGFKLGIDDFGTGYSSLSYLNRFPVDILKVDRSFISQIDKSGKNTSVNITNSIITLAHSLGVKVVAEGIEGLYHLAWLQQQKCDYGQGFLFSKPLTAEDATRFAEKGLDWTWKC